MYKEKLTENEKIEFASIISGMNIREKAFAVSPNGESIYAKNNFYWIITFNDFYCQYTLDNSRPKTTLSSKQYGQWMYKIIEKKEGKLAAEEYRKKYNQYWQGHKKEVVEHIRRCAESEVEKLNQQYNDEYFMG